MSKKQRLDLLLLERGLASSRNHAYGLILSGEVLVEDQPIDKVGKLIAIDAAIRIRTDKRQFVSRGGDKISAAFSHFKINLLDKVVLDVGASTGGFTDCMLQLGARLVYATDVGYNQLDYRLRQDSRVVVFEKMHAKNLASIAFNPVPTFATVDVSFIGIRKILSHVKNALYPPFELMLLVKPQFELEREYVGKGGVVRNLEHQLYAVSLVKDYCEELKLKVDEPFASPLRGDKKGNQEYFLYCQSK